MDHFPNLRFWPNLFSYVKMRSVPSESPIGRLNARTTGEEYRQVPKQSLAMFPPCRWYILYINIYTHYKLIFACYDLTGFRDFKTRLVLKPLSLSFKPIGD